MRQYVAIDVERLYPPYLFAKMENFYRRGEYMPNGLFATAIGLLASISKRRRLMVTLLLVPFSQTVSAQDAALLQKVDASFACPSEAYDETEPVNYSLEYLDRYKWEGDSSTFKVRIDRQTTMSGTARRVQTTRHISVVAAKFSDIGEVVISEDGDGDPIDVAIRCKGERECVTSKAAERSAKNGDFQASELSFHMCSESVAKDLKAALQKMIGK